MKYVVTKNDRVIAGPVEWSTNFLKSVISLRAGVDANITSASKDLVPLTIEEGLIIRFAEEVIPDHDERYQRLEGPVWSFTADTGTATFTVQEKDLSLIAGNLKAAVTNKRYLDEISGTQITIQGNLVTIETDRDTRNIFVQALLLTPAEGTRNWKFPKENVWLDLTYTDLQAIVAAGATYVQSCFDWEKTKYQEIDTIVTSGTSSDLMAIYTAIEPVLA